MATVAVRGKGMKEIEQALYALSVFALILVIGMCLLGVQMACGG